MRGWLGAERRNPSREVRVRRLPHRGRPNSGAEEAPGPIRAGFRPASRRRRRRPFSLCCLGLWMALAACAEQGRGDEREVAAAHFSPAWLRQSLVGPPGECEADARCASAVCRFERCVGALDADQRWLQETISRRIAGALRDERERVALVTAVEELLAAAPPRKRARMQARGAFLLSFVRGDAATETLARWLSSKSPDLRRAAVLALVAQGDERGMKVTETELEDEHDARRRAEAARALGGAKGERALGALTRSLQDESRFVRRNAVRSLVQLGDRRAAAALVRALDEGPVTEKVLILEALRALTGQRLGLDAEEWKRVVGGPT